MNVSRIYCIVISAICFITFNDAARSDKQQTIIMRGRVTFPGGSKIPIESGSKLIVELQDTSLADAPAITIARGTGKATKFPMAFAIKYTPKQVANGIVYSIHVQIRNKDNQLLYTNNVRSLVTPLGPNRTKFIDVPVILVRNSTPIFNKREWPELVGKNGEEVVKIIKKQTGFTNVMTVKEGSMITMDYRTDRVRVFVNNAGIVIRTPTTG